MEVSRVDPYIIRWSDDGTVALATESADLQFLKLIPSSLNQMDIKWMRSRLTVKDRVLDMQWSGTLASRDSGCLLACLLSSGDIIIVETDGDPSITTCLEGEYSSLNWQHNCLITGDRNGKVVKYRGSDVVWDSQLPGKVSIISCQKENNLIGAVLSDNSCWIWSGEWEMVTEASRFYVNCAKLVGDQLLSLRCGKLYINERILPLETYLPGIIVTVDDNWGVVHTNGNFWSPNNELVLPKIQGDLIHIDMHRFLPIGIAILNSGSSASHHSGWKFPILSSQYVSLYLFPTVGELKLPRRIDFASPMAWLAYKVLDKVPNLPNESAYKLPEIVRRGEISLETELRELFLSEWFDMQRHKWFLGQDRPAILAQCRSAIASVISRAESKSSLDKIIVNLYTKKNAAFTLKGDFIDDEFDLSNDSISTDVNHIKSKKERLWKRCALTLLPLLSVNTYESEDGEFTVYINAPLLERADEITDGKATTNRTHPIMEALLASATFCPFNGCKWQKQINT